MNKKVTRCKHRTEDGHCAVKPPYSVCMCNPNFGYADCGCKVPHSHGVVEEVRK